MNVANCTEGQTLYTLQIILGPNRWSLPGYHQEEFLWKVQAEDKDRTILYGTNYYVPYKYPMNETFCLDTESCYDITIKQKFSYGPKSGFKLYAGGELRSQDTTAYDNIDHFENTCFLPTSSPTYDNDYSYDYDYSYDDDHSYNDENSTFEFNGPTTKFFSVVIIILLLISILKLRGNSNQRLANAQQQNNNSNDDNNNLAEAEKYDRRIKILTSIITKKVLPKQDLSLEKSNSHQASMLQGISNSSNFKLSNDGDDKNDNAVSSSFFPICLHPNDADQNHSTANGHKSIDEEEEIVVAPFSTSQLQQDEKNIGGYKNSNSTRQGKLKKGDIYEQSLRSLRNIMNIKASSTSSLSSPKSCPICMEPYEAGDEIAWSKNENCLHTFHQECIVAWLMTNNDCPLCRQDYLCDESTEV